MNNGPRFVSPHTLISILSPLLVVMLKAACAGIAKQHQQQGQKMDVFCGHRFGHLFSTPECAGDRSSGKRTDQ
jgi:hypothetical protein